MATFETLQTLLANGSDVILTSGMAHEKIEALAATAMASGARLTILAATGSDFLIALSKKYGRSVAFVNGISDFKKD
ncbi:hypothetical protein [Burkholderia cepacia]|uniref:hypothetical protein n=1 Tax=Burkholderia cepacia TaxID=292 RepID=UPI0012D954A4|nr:hypothetical protein [Burkholderia cepacia]